MIRMFIAQASAVKVDSGIIYHKFVYHHASLVYVPNNPETRIIIGSLA